MWYRNDKEGFWIFRGFIYLVSSVRVMDDEVYWKSMSNDRILTIDGKFKGRFSFLMWISGREF